MISKKNIEDIDYKETCEISNIMEKFGKFQLKQYILVCFGVIFISMSNVNYVFIAGDLHYRCRVNECEDANSTAQNPSWWPDTNIDRCSAPVLRRGEQVCTNDSFTGNLTTCGHWIYENNNTVVAELKLACEPWKQSLIGTIHSLGLLISMTVFGWISDVIGRKPTYIICIVFGFIGFAKTFATAYCSFVIIEFMEALSTGGNFSAAMVLILEVSGKKYRPMSGIIYTYSIYLGECVYALIAVYVPYWKNIARIIYAPCLFFLVYISLINESPRWQIVTGRMKDAKKSFKQIAISNKICINDQELESLDDAQMKEKFNIGRNQEIETIRHVFRSKEILIRMFVFKVCRFTNNFIYYGMMLNAVWLPGNKYLTFFLTTLMSFPGELLAIYLIYKVGRKIPLQVGYVLSGVLCLISGFTPESYPTMKLTLVLMAKIVVSGCFSSVVTYGLELFPTSVRGTVLGLAGFFTRLGSMLAPLTPMLNPILPGLPFMLFGASSIIASLLLTLTPETKDMPLFDTIKQVESYRKEKNSTITEAKKP